MKLERAGVVAVLSAAVAAQGASAMQPVTGPTAIYWISAATSTGMGGMGMGGGRASASTLMAMRQGMSDPGAVNHTLVLQLGSARRPDGGDPTAEHDPPPGLGVGPVLPLVTPRAEPAHAEAAPGPPAQYQPPRGRMLIFWGCGEHAGPGQPYVIDFASLGATAAGEKFMALARGLAVTPMQPPSPARNATYGEWPNEQSSAQVPGDGSLQGEHQIHGNYTPPISFSLTAGQDFLPPFQLTENTRNPSGSASLGWRRVDGAQGYFATMFGAGAGAGSGEGGGTDVVMWTSSETQASAFGMPDYLSDGEIARLVAAHALMPSTQTECVIPEEAVAAAGRAGFFNLVAYGGETNISSPPRPPPPAPWRIAWAVKIRYRSSTGGLVGMDMSQLMGGHGQTPPDQGQPPPPRHSFNPFGGGFLP